MAQPVSPVLPPTAEQASRVDTDHFIIWFDQHIGLPDQCVMLKCSFFLAMDPTTGLYERSLNIDDIDRSIRLELPILVQLDQVQFMFQVFDDVEKCFKVIEQNLTKRIFLITSGSKGKILIPSLVANFPETFKAGYWMYVFCANMCMVQVGDVMPTNLWAMKFADRILMYDHQDNLLSRMVADIACYFSKKAEDLVQSQQLESAVQHFSWAKQMYTRFETISKTNMTSTLCAIEQQIRNIEQQRRQEAPDSDEDAAGEPCGQ